MTWHAKRFEPDPRKVRVECAICSRPYYLPRCKAAKYVTCGNECATERLRRIKEAKRRECELCRATFYPRSQQLQNGGGRFCTLKCSRTALLPFLHSDAARQRARASIAKALETGTYVPARGPNHPRWQGGPKAYAQRCLENGKSRDRCRAYRQANPEKVREFVASRNRRKYGRLPKGTVADLHKLQKGRCAICAAPLGKSYHTDHIIPLAKGGKHERLNIQLLCRPCNCRKSAKDPIQFMQELGRLL